MKCLQCDSSRIVADVKVAGYYEHDTRLIVYAEPEAMIFKQPQSSMMKANVCADCGFVMFSVAVKDAQRLERYQKRNEAK